MDHNRDEIVAIKDAWLSENSSHHLALHVGVFGDEFRRTNCELTALAIRVALTRSGDDWDELEPGEMSSLAESRTTPDSAVYQVTFHEASPKDDYSELYNASHVLTVIDRRITQSYFREYEWSSDDQENVAGLEILGSGIVTSPDQWFTLTGVRNTPKLPQYVWFWVPTGWNKQHF